MPLSRGRGASPAALFGSAALALLVAGPATATPLSLQAGDVVSVVEWGAQKDDLDGDPGGTFTTDPDSLDVLGDIESVTVQNSLTRTVTGTNFTFSATLSSFSTTDLGGNQLLVLADFTGVTGHDIVVTDSTGTILTAEFASALQFGGVIDTTNPQTVDTSTQQVNATDIEITGGDPLLTAALGEDPSGADGILELTGTIDGFDPSLSTLLADDVLFNETFTFSGGGQITPVQPSAFVPEPTTVVLVGSGLLGLAVAGRRRR